MQLGGSEQVTAALSRAFGDADVITSAYDPEIAHRLGLASVQGTFLQRAPMLERAHHYFLPLYDSAFRHVDLSGYDAVISSAAFFAKSVCPPPGVPHVCYCHTPIRFLWEPEDSTLAELPKNPAVRRAVTAMKPLLRRADRRAVKHVDEFVANSSHIASRIAALYGRQARVVAPPVEIDRYRGDFEAGDYLLAAARLYPYKRVDIAIEVANRLRIPLKVAGDGSDLARLRELAGPTVEFLGWVDEADKPELFGSARAFIAPQLEDFGIAMVEAIAAGTPVVALAAGGALDIVEPGVNGMLVDSQNAAAFGEAVESLAPPDYQPGPMRRSVEKFAAPVFARRMREIVDEAVETKRQSPEIAAR
jgi:glycosyltransferase involved in cell wall biosynthesis